jgi:hypothetical protein
VPVHTSVYWQQIPVIVHSCPATVPRSFAPPAVAKDSTHRLLRSNWIFRMGFSGMVKGSVRVAVIRQSGRTGPEPEDG